MSNFELGMLDKYKSWLALKEKYSI